LTLSCVAPILESVFLKMSGTSRDEPNIDAILQAIQTDNVDVDNAIVNERNNDMQYVKRDLQSLKDVTFDVASMVVQQGDELQVGQQRSSRARMAVEAGTREMKFARTFKKKTRTKCYVFVCLAVCLILLGSAFVFVFFYDDGRFWKEMLAKLGVSTDR